MIIIGFNVRPLADARRAAEREGVDVRTYSVIYQITEDLRNAMEGCSRRSRLKKRLARRKSNRPSKASKVGRIAGCLVTDGKATREASVRLVRDGTVVWTGKLGSLVASKTMSERSRMARSAALCSKASPMSRRATCSSSSRRNRSSRPWSRMATACMRRINEVLREVVGVAIGNELSDPRIGFVTVTSVETSPDLRTAKVFVSVLGTEQEREETLSGLSSSRGVIQSKIAAQTRMKRTPTISFHYDKTIEQGVRISSSWRRSDERAGRSGGHRRRARCGRAALARDPGFLLTATRGTGSRARVAAGHALPARCAGQGFVDVHGGKGVPAADRVPLLAFGGGFDEPPGQILPIGRSSFWILRQHRSACRSTSSRRAANQVINIDHHHDNTRFGDFNLVDTAASCTAEIVYELAILLGAPITKEIAAALYVGLVTDTGKFMYENTNARTHLIAADLIEAGVEVDDHRPSTL